MNDSLLILYVLVSMGWFLIISVGIILFVNRSQKKVSKIQLHEKELHILYQNELLRNTVKTQEEERKRIASELHVDIASKLNIIHLHVHLLKKTGSLNESSLELLGQIDIALKASIERTRNISHELLPQVFTKFGIQYALIELERDINSAQGVIVRIESAHLLRIQDELKLVHLYRIIQELTQNTLKHANAKHIWITFETCQENMLCMQYRDDGAGFDTKKESKGLGLYNIRTRAKLLNGTAEFKSLPEIKGLLVTIKFENND
jgi:signal transduction histidine kinase